MYYHFPMGEILLQASTNGICQLTRHFQQKMNDLFHGFEFIHAYIDDILVLTKRYWTYHVQNMEVTLNKLNVKGLQCNIENSFFGKTKM